MRTRWFLSSVTKGNQMWWVATLQQSTAGSKHTPADVAQLPQHQHGHKNSQPGAAFSHSGFTVAEFHAGLLGHWWFIPPPAFKKGSAFSKNSPEVQPVEQPLSRPCGGKSEEISATAPKWSDSHKLQLKKRCLDLSAQQVLFRVSFLLFWSFYELTWSFFLSESWGMQLKGKSRLTVPFPSSRNRRKYLVSLQERGELFQPCTSQGEPRLSPYCLLLPTKALQGGVVQLRPQWEGTNDSKAQGKALFSIPLNKVFLFKEKFADSWGSH